MADPAYMHAAALAAAQQQGHQSHSMHFQALPTRPRTLSSKSR